MTPFFEIGQIITSMFFLFFFLFPILGLVEKVIYFIYAEKSYIRASMHTYTFNEFRSIVLLIEALVKKFIYTYV